MIANYALFAWEPHEASGGMGDFIGINSLEQCQMLFLEFVRKHDGNARGHIAVMPVMRVAYEAEVISIKEPSDAGWAAPKGWRVEWLARVVVAWPPKVWA